MKSQGFDPGSCVILCRESQECGKLLELFFLFQKIQVTKSLNKTIVHPPSPAGSLGAGNLGLSLRSPTVQAASASAVSSTRCLQTAGALFLL